MHNISANEGDVVTVESTTTEIGKYALFEPQSIEFLEISNPTALLENALRGFACITKGEIIVIHYNNRIYELKVLDTKPRDVINIIECDMDVRKKIICYHMNIHSNITMNRILIF